ncbi:flagellar filament capping protein FliD [Arthrobacter sp. JSM 101049]|uniref:flagellar filament capping protein FliD n=1 Tax=Arthrobacter sp. JSM 101049 TaxID=929097 RepID=UPI0035636600
MGISLDGLSSGLDTTALINTLMQAEAIPQNILKNKVSAAQTMVSALQALNTKVSALGELAEKAAKPDSLQLFTTTSSSDAAKATAGSGAAPGSVDITVNQTAQAQVSVSGKVSEWTEASFTITKADGSVISIAADSTSLDDVVRAVNNSDAGVKAVMVAAGDGTFRLQFSAADTGTSGKFTISGTAGSNLTEAKTAQDASITLWSGVTGVEQEVISSSNTFEDLLPGVDITVSKASTSPVTITVARDDEAAGKVAEDLVDNLNSLFGFISANSSVTSDPDGTTKGMIFTADSTARDVNQRILSAATMPVNGKSPSEIGISITKTGTIEYDAEKFQQALTENPAMVEATLQEIASRVHSTASALSDKYDGQITARIKGQESTITRLDDQVMDWDRRLATRRATLEKTYAAMEVQLSALNAQSSWLTSQLSSLPSTNGSSS